MKNKIFTAVMMLALTVGFSACNEKWEPRGTDTVDKGTLSTADLAIDLTNAEQIISKSRATVDLTDFIVTVTDRNGMVVNEWTYAQMPGLPVFNVGTYTLKVESGKPQKAAWNAPYYVGEKQFEIVKDKVTNAGTVTCTLQNLKVTVKFDAELVEASAGDLDCEIRVNEQGVLHFTPATVQSGYFEVVPGNTTMVATFSGTVNGYKEEFIRLYKDLNPGQHRIITFALKGADIKPDPETGFIDPTGGFNVDFSVIDEDLSGNVNIGGEDVIGGQERPGHEDWPDDPENPENPDDPKPPVTDDCIDFDSEKMVLGEGNVNHAPEYGPKAKEAIVNIVAEHGISNLWVTINSVGLDEDELIAIGLPKKFDLANPADGEIEAALGTLGFPTGSAVVGLTSVDFDITQFVPLLPNFTGPHEFLIEVIDAQGHSKTLSLNFVNE